MTTRIRNRMRIRRTSQNRNPRHAPKLFSITTEISGNVILSEAKDLAIAQHQQDSPRRTPRNAEDQVGIIDTDGHRWTRIEPSLALDLTPALNPVHTRSLRLSLNPLRLPGRALDNHRRPRHRPNLKSQFAISRLRLPGASVGT